MLKIQKLFYNHFFCYNLLDVKSGDLNYFRKLGRSIKQFQSQFLKGTNFGLGLFEGTILVGFVIGDLITVEKKLEYEILLLYVSSKKEN